MMNLNQKDFAYVNGGVFPPFLSGKIGICYEKILIRFC